MLYIFGDKTRNKNGFSAQLLFGNLRVAPARGPLSINTRIYFPWVALQLRPLAHVGEKLHHISGACLPGHGSKVMAGGGCGAAEQQSGEETGSLLGSVWALLSRHRQAAPRPDGVPGPAASGPAEFPSARAILC